MLPKIRIFGVFEIGLYSAMFIIGFFCALFIGRKIYKYSNKIDFIFSAVYAIVGMIVGMKLLFLITRLPQYIRILPEFLKDFGGDIKAIFLFSSSFLLGGNVFYGGLIGALIGVILYCKIYKVEMLPLADLFAILIPFVHAFGRIGCFLGGCCYGKEYHGFGAIQFPYNEYIPKLSAVPRFPTQLIEAIMNFACFFVLLYLYKKSKIKEGKLIGCYICYYSIFRFIIEFFRGDILRGSIFGLYTSQIISLLLLPIGIFILKSEWIVRKFGVKSMEND